MVHLHDQRLMTTDKNKRYFTCVLFIFWIEWGNYDVRTWKSNLPRVPSRFFPMGFSNGVFQFMSKIKPVVNITWRYFYMLFYNVNYTHPHPKLKIWSNSFLKTCVLNKELDKNVWAVSVCSLRCRTKRKSIIKLCYHRLYFTHKLKNPIIKPHRKISKEPAANYSSGFWHHSSPTLLCVSLFYFLGLMSVKITKTYMKNCST